MDAVNKPNHYMLFADGTEAIDVIKASLTTEEFRGYCKGNVLKYRLRAGKKDKLEQDIAKAETYAKMLADAIPFADLAEQLVFRNKDYTTFKLPGEFYDAPKRVPAVADECGPLMDCTKCKKPCS